MADGIRGGGHVREGLELALHFAGITELRRRFLNDRHGQLFDDPDNEPRTAYGNVDGQSYRYRLPLALVCSRGGSTSGYRGRSSRDLTLGRYADHNDAGMPRGTMRENRAIRHGGGRRRVPPKHNGNRFVGWGHLVDTVPADSVGKDRRKSIYIPLQPGQDAGSVHEFLKHQGISVKGVQQYRRENAEGHEFLLTVPATVSDSEIQAGIEAFVLSSQEEASESEARVLAGVEALQRIRATSPAKRTDTESVLLLLLELSPEAGRVISSLLDEESGPNGG